jgi:hypothetical protein
MRGHPEKVTASGGAAWRPRTELYGNIYDHMSSDFVYPGGVHFSSACRQYPRGTYYNRGDLILGTKGRSDGLDMGTKGTMPYVEEHIRLVNSILGRGPYLNEAQRVAESTLTAIMGRESAYSGMQITWEQIMNSQQDLQPKEIGYGREMPPAALPVPGRYKFV